MQYYERQYPQFGFGGGITTGIKYLLVSTIAVFILQQFARGLEPLFGFVPAFLYTRFYIWQPVTYMFLHGGVWHILINMFILWMFGTEVERHLGTKEFLKLYFITGAGASLFYFVFNASSTIPMIGASGAIYGVMTAFAVMFPNRVITLLLFLVLPVQIKAKYLVMIFGALAFFNSVRGWPPGVANLAHLGGILIGFVYMKLDWRMDYLSRWLHRQVETRKLMRETRRRQKIQRLRERVDEILDKINEVGYDNLTDEEKRILKDASEHLSQEKEG